MSHAIEPCDGRSQMRSRDDSCMRHGAAPTHALALLSWPRRSAMPPPAAARDFLWKVTGKTGTVYLVGSVHMLTQDFYPLSPALEDAFKESDLLVEEADLAELLAPQAQLLMLSRGMLPSDQSLDTVISPATFALVTKRAAALGLPIEPLKRFKPWSLALMLTQLEWQKAGFDAELGLDRHFYDRRAIGRQTRSGPRDRGVSDLAVRRDPDGSAGTDAGRDAEGSRQRDGEPHRRWPRRGRPATRATVERIVLEDVKQEPAMYQRLLVDAQPQLAAAARSAVRPRPAAPSSSSAPRIWSDPTA